MLTLLATLALTAPALAGEIQWAQMTGRSGFLAVGTSRIDGNGTAYIDNGAPVFVSGDYLRYVNIDWDYKYGQAGLIKMKMSSGDKCLDAGLTPGNGTPLKVWDCYEGYDAQNFKVHDSRIELVGKVALS
ncbi:G-X-X-X-Q-X-W domain-containing protein [Trichosporon asahii var. asahii CBS 8904]|uniref:G-X-X-X-Q-X-W domain-containing protein n=2 Tax=Trichosporon asahii var. asahii TaxID=189963 RepID=K1VHE1_TRIAC|nr:G-X-X-X-Q-X-W domain-containing protein [Trichosporon asahii var. asahii CBS 2479]EJT45378.1 G-X-X-X-Q-X-W domain-containing protein [Trichosporon asahii var. asahii CBS 2479]EKD00251.1 G-X-X-X-Q-X-W domain-containing protein [Trichosporon asahii var. asahii CBS 8904]